ncbi:MAG: ADP-ribosylglycohydrolase family protein [Candidatus Aenigmatarchaeota archaeon]
MVGLAVGDALGMPCEGYSYSTIKKYFGKITDFIDPNKNHPNNKLKAGMYTDDTEQAIILAESLIENNGLDVNHFASKLFEYGENIIEHPELDRWIGSTFKRAVKNYISGLPVTKCGVKSKSCGSAMRVAPVGLFYYWDFKPNILENAAKSSRITHLGAETTAAAEAVALYVTLATRGNHSPKDMSETVTQMIEKESKIIAKRIKKAYELRDEKPEKVKDILGGSELARETVSTAIYSFHHSPYDFEEAVLTSVNMGDDTDSRAAITGAISGAFLGIYNIPYKWVKKVEDGEKLIQLGEKLYDASQKRFKI